MKISRVSIENFKLLRDISIEFSVDRERPLTAIRAENGSGKTSLLLAMLWGFYGRNGLPLHANGMRLTSTAEPIGRRVPVRVMIEFEHEGHGGRGCYRLIRSCEEKPLGPDQTDRGPEQLSLYRISDAGEEVIPRPETFLRQVVPSNLREVFFTNGDDVQEFMSGKVDRADRQRRVHDAIKALLGLEQLYIAREDITSADRRFRKEAAKGSGRDDLAAAIQLAEDAEDAASAKQDEITAMESRLEQIRDRRKKWEAELAAITDVGDLTKINNELAEREQQLEVAGRRLDTALKGARGLLSGEELGWSMIRTALDGGAKVLADLADRGIIPGTSIEVVRDRLTDGVCICGTPLPEGSSERGCLERLLRDHSSVDRTKELLTAAHHVARHFKDSHDARVAEGRTFAAIRAEIVAEVTTANDDIRSSQAHRKHLQDLRTQIDEESVAQLASDVQRAESQLIDAERRLAVLRHEVADLLKQAKARDEEVRKLEQSIGKDDRRRVNAEVASDMKQLINEVIRRLEVEHVQRVASLMSARFLEIVGSDPELDASVFGSVVINDAFDIEVRTPTGSRLDFDAEINGASQRALTLSFIWALMEVAEVEAPRIIDTPLGMVAGAVKTRLTDAITTPPANSGTDYQVVLLLTRSELRDVEDLIDRRSGVIRTMSCSKDAKDLRFPWGEDRPEVRICRCTHRQSCAICARTYDDASITFRNEDQ